MKIILASIVLLLTACTTTQVQQHNKQDISWPDPIQPLNVKWIVKQDQDHTVYIAQTVEDSANTRIWLNDILRYTKDLQQMVCYYKTNPDPKCTKTKEP